MPDLSPRPDLPPFPAKDQPLREDVRQLGALLGRLLREQGRPDLYPRVESVRRECIRRRAGESTAEAAVVAELGGLAPFDALEVVRAFSAWFELVNLAERTHRVRRGRSYSRTKTPQPGGLEDVLVELQRRGVDAREIQAALESTTVDLVFTAHPTEAVRRTLLTKEVRMARALLARPASDARALLARPPSDPRAPVARRTDEDANSSARDHALARVREELTAAWQTEEHRVAQPTVADEVEHAMFFLADVIWRSVPRVRASLRRALKRRLGPEHAHLADAVRLRFGTWIGGDMDGNPSVGPDTVRATLARQAEIALDRYRAEVRRSFQRLSQSRSRVGVSHELERGLVALEQRTGDAASEIPARYVDMPYRRFLWLVDARLKATAARTDGAYASAAEFERDLTIVVDSLRANRGAHAGLRAVERLVERVRCFGFHLATLDLRRDALDHRAALAEILGDAEFAKRPAAERGARIVRALQDVPGSVRPERDLGTDGRFALAVVRSIQDSRAQYGEAAIGLFIISMTQGPDDVLGVLLLARAAGLVSRTGAVPLDVTPLFETVEDLESAPSTVTNLLKEAAYRAHVASRGDVQWIMLGYSDSTKTAGIVAARVSLQRAQRDLIAVASEHGVALRFFHGRGGSTSRGGSKPRDAVLALPHGALAGHLRVTEQGEVIRAKYGLVEIAERTLELIVGATIERTALDAREESRGEPRREPGEELYDELASAGRDEYRALLNAPGFLDYFAAATPIDVVERLGLGSRPSRRRAMRGVEDLRAIPWVFAWTQSRHMLPGWYGSGQALDRAIETHGLATVRDIAKRSLFLRTLLRDLEMVLAKSDLGIARLYTDLAGSAGAPHFARIQVEHALTCARVLEVLESPRLLNDDPVLQRSILLRNPYVDPLSFVQVDLLARWRAGGREDADLEAALFATVHGIARGLKNTG